MSPVAEGRRLATITATAHHVMKVSSEKDSFQTAARITATVDLS
jgi:hypothetical protein